MKALALGINSLITRTVIKKLYLCNKKINRISTVASSAVPNIASKSSLGKDSWVYEASLYIESAREVNMSLFCFDIFIIFCKFISDWLSFDIISEIP